MNAQGIAAVIRHTTSVPVDAEQVTICGADGYAVTELERGDAYLVAAAIVNAFGADPEAGDAQVRVIRPRAEGASWRGHLQHTVRVEVAR